MFVCPCKCVNDGGKEKQDDERVSEGDEVSPSNMIDHSSLTLLLSACLMHPLPECTRIMSEKCLTIAHSLSLIILHASVQPSGRENIPSRQAPFLLRRCLECRRVILSYFFRTACFRTELGCDRKKVCVFVYVRAFSVALEGQAGRQAVT